MNGELINLSLLPENTFDIVAALAVFE